MKDIFPDPKEFTTKDMQLFCTLYGRDHHVIPGGIMRDSERTIWFTFDNTKVNDDVKLYREGKPLRIDLQKALWAYTLFRCILHGEQRDMFTILAMKVMGNEVSSDGIWRDGGMIRYEFEGHKARDDRDLFWEGQPIEVDHCDLWRSMGWFRSNIHST